jgi:8-oxo-dGTP diphosphatase
LATTSKPVVLVVAVALIEKGRVLLAQRPANKAMAGLWEFPGGKVETGEKPENALVRELHEELGITVAVPDLKPLTFASHTYEKFHLLMPLYECREWQGAIVPTEHQNIAWANAADLSAYEMPPADLPLIEHIARALAL